MTNFIAVYLLRNVTIITSGTVNPFVYCRLAQKNKTLLNLKLTTDLVVGESEDLETLQLLKYLCFVIDLTRVSNYNCY